MSFVKSFNNHREGPYFSWLKAPTMVRHQQCWHKGRKGQAGWLANILKTSHPFSVIVKTNGSFAALYWTDGCVYRWLYKSITLGEEAVAAAAAPHRPNAVFYAREIWRGNWTPRLQTIFTSWRGKSLRLMRGSDCLYWDAFPRYLSPPLNMSRCY